MKKSRTWNYWKKHKEQKCECIGYWFPHRKGGGACEFSVRADYYAAKRQGLSEAEALQLLNSSVLEFDANRKGN